MKFNLSIFMAVIFLIIGIIFLVFGCIHFEAYVNCAILAAVSFLFAFSYLDSNRMNKLEKRIYVLERIYD